MGERRGVNSLDRLIVALCLDYKRRREIIEARTASRRTDTELRYYNFKLYDAVAEIVGERFAEGYIDEIGRNIGYAKSALYCFSEVTYKEYKRRAMDNIAKRLHLL